MSDTPAWTDPGWLVGTGGALAVIGAAIKAVLDARKDRGSQRASSEDSFRDDLIKEVSGLRGELTASRKEHNEQFREHQKAIRECEERAVAFERDLGKVSAENIGLRRRYHQMADAFQEFVASVDLDRSERGLPPLSGLPRWVSEDIPGPTATKQDRPKREKPG